MSTEAALLAAVAAAPGDALRRLVYADWLDEQGDPRAEMVRVMEEMRRHPVWSDEYQRLRPARNRLWASLDPAWLEAMGYQKVYRPLFGTMPEKREHRWRLAEEFIDIWHGGLKEGDGYTDAELDAAEQRLGCKLPAALREWHRLGGKRRDVWSNQDHFVPPDRIRIDDQYGLVVQVENQGCTRWYVRLSDLHLPDPPVYGGDQNRLVADSVSAFALFVLVLESQFCGIVCELYPERPDGVTTVSARFQRTELPEWHWFDQPVHIWEATDAIIIREYANEWAYATCRTEAAYQELVRDFADRVIRV